MNIIKFLTSGIPESRLLNLSLLALRVLASFSLVLNHGWPTFKGVLNGEDSFPDPLGFGSAISMGMVGFAEFVCAVFVALGLFTRISVIPIVLSFAVAFFVFHSDDPFQKRELAYLYLSAFSIVLMTGPGKYALDHKIFKSKLT